MTTDRKPDEQTSKRQSTGTAAAAGSNAAATGSDAGSSTDRGTGTEHSGQTAAAGCTATERLRQQAEDYLHDCDRSARYHTARRAFLDKWHRWMIVAVVLSGSSAVAALSGDNKILSGSIMLLTAVLAAIEVVFNITDRARDHELLARRFYQIASTITPEYVNSEQVGCWRRAILGVYVDEPAVYHALNAECYNAAAQALGKRERQRIKRRHYLLRHWWRFSAEDFPKIPEPQVRNA